MASPERPSVVPPVATNLQAIFGKSAGLASPDASVVSPTRGRPARTTLSAGSNDHLGIAAGHQLAVSGKAAGLSKDDPSKKWSIVSDFIASHGDRTVHFSGEAFEMLHSLPVKRYVIVTDQALYRIAQTTVDTGIFFDCRLELDALAQLVAQDVAADEGRGVAGGAEVQLFTRAASASASSGARSDRSVNVQLGATLNFGSDTSRRKAFLLAVCVVRPTLSILQKRNVVHADPADGSVLNASAGTKSGAFSPGRSPAAKVGQTPDRHTPRFLRETESAARKRRDSLTEPVASPTPRATPYSPAKFRQSGATSAAAQQSQSRRKSQSQAASEPLPHQRPAMSPNRAKFESDMSDKEFLKAQQALRESLSATSLDSAAATSYEFDTAASRPPEESIDRTLERERIKAMINSREAQLVQNIEFKVKYPQKVPTRVPPGVEYDKAHEERRALPEDFSDSELLGPSLFPLWKQWKASGGLLGEDGMPSDQWTMYDSNDLIDSLAAREDFLYGHIGARALRRLVDMRELVEREKQMFLNKQRMVMNLAAQHDEDDADDASDAYGAPSPARSAAASKRSRKSGPTVDHSNRGRVVTGQYTKVRPFKLSKGPSSEQRLKLMDTQHLLGDMKRNFEHHLQTLHQLKKEQLQRELDRAVGDEDDLDDLENA